jgi:hypothetical protein
MGTTNDSQFSGTGLPIEVKRTVGRDGWDNEHIKRSFVTIIYIFIINNSYQQITIKLIIDISYAELFHP